MRHYQRMQMARKRWEVAKNIFSSQMQNKSFSQTACGKLRRSARKKINIPLSARMTSSLCRRHLPSPGEKGEPCD
jgi:hypothetical protein